MQLNEVSSALTLFRKYTDDPKYKSYRGVLALKPLIKYLHSQQLLPHDMSNIREVDAFDWRDIKSSAQYSDRKYWLLIIGTSGSACIMPTSSGSWRTYLSSLHYKEVLTDTHNRINDAVNEIKPEVGKVIARYMMVGKPVEKRKKPRDPFLSGYTNSDLYNKFKPLINKAVTQAIADVRGMVITQIKNDAFEKATAKVQKLNTLSNLLDLTDGDQARLLDPYLMLAVLSTASHFYPDITGEIRKQYNTYGSSFNVGPTQVRRDIANGDTKKLAYVLYFLKRELVALS